ncbi:MAG TPA: hypothetical protein VN577_10035 [Terriglobales bacterium]|nr:hypothetical protein [Terriglobales bacterium]
MSNLTEQTAEIKKALDVQKASWSQSTGLVQYNLEAPAKFLVPVLTPLRNITPRVKTQGGTQANWKAITAINLNNVAAGISEGSRNAEIVPQVANYSAAFVGFGQDNSFTFEAEFAAEGFDDVRARSSENLLKSVMIEEEKLMISGHGTFGLGVTPQPTLTLATGGTLALSSTNVYCVALTADGLARTTIAAGCPGQISRTNADGSVDLFGGGNAQVSAAGTITPTSGNQKIVAKVAAVPGAAAYVWYLGGSASTAAITKITTVNTYTFDGSESAGSQKANDAKVAADYSANSLVFDGLIAQAAKSGSNAYVKSLDGASLTSDGAGGIVEFDAALQDRWDNYRLTPDTIWVNSAQAKAIKKLVVGNGGAPLVRLNMDANGGVNGLTAGAVVASYLNPFGLGSGEEIPIKIHPYLPAGTILMTSKSIPYPLSNVADVFRMLLRRDYYFIQYPLRTRKYEFGIYADGVLQHYFPPSMVLIQNVA